MLPCSVWLTVTLIGLEDRAHRSIVVISAGSHLRVLLATVATAATGCLLLTAAGLVLPLMLGAHTPGLADLALGIAAQLTCACTGMAIGLVCSRLIFRRPGHALVLALVLLLAVLLGKGVSPVNIMLTACRARRTRRTSWRPRVPCSPSRRESWRPRSLSPRRSPAGRHEPHETRAAHDRGQARLRTLRNRRHGGGPVVTEPRGAASAAFGARTAPNSRDTAPELWEPHA